MTDKQQKPPQRVSRRQRHRAQQRKSWLGFLGKLALFFVPVTIASVWLVWMLIGFGTELPILVLDFDKQGASDPTESKRSRVWHCETYGRASVDGGIKLPETIVYGGPNKDALVIFNDLLATDRNPDGQLEPCVFVPATGEEHQSHQFYGLMNNPTQQHRQQWQPFKDYLIDILDQLAKQTSNRRDKKKLLLAFDIDHPDLPGRLPPQANQFIGLCQNQWEALSIELADTYPQFDVHVWLSHAPGQKSYWDSNPTHVESFFKHRFERGVTGDVCIEIPIEKRTKRDVSYSHLKQYVGKRVASDASNHYLIQTPVFLEPPGMADFPLLRFSSPLKSAVAEPGKLFGYRKREKLPELDTLWKKFKRVRHEYEWAVDNPLAVQQTNMLLLQMERLWYEGKGNTGLFAALRGRVNTLLDTHHTLKPVQHSLSDALADAQRMDVNFLQPPKLPQDWLETLPDYNLLPEGEERSAIEDKTDARAKMIRRWQAEYPDWRGGHLVWKSLLAPPGGIIDRQMIQQGLSLLTTEQTTVNLSDQPAEQVVFDEILFLQRLVNELVWPDRQSDAHTKFERLVRDAMEMRDKSNRFAAMMSPVLVDQFAAAFEALESERRQFEDRLFAHDGLFNTADNRLSHQYSELIQKYEQLLASSNTIAQRFAAAQSKLTSSPHDFRYRVESLASAGNDSTDTGWIEEYFAKVEKLSQTKIEAFSQSDPAAELDKLGPAEQAVFEGVLEESATFPERDLAAFADTNLNLGVADGNLLGRRLVFWPDLALRDRLRLHEGLSTQYVTLDEDENDLASVRQVDFSIEHHGLMEPVIETLHQLPAMQATTDPIEVPSSGEQFLLQVAAKTSRLTPYLANSTTELSLAELINGFHARKSDLEFRRTAYDLCGTKAEGKDSFVQRSLKMHLRLIEDRLIELCNLQATQELSSIRAQIADVWRATYDKTDTLTWSERATQVDEFCDAFGRWDWNREQQQAVSRALVKPMNYEIDHDNKMMFSVSAVGASFGKIAGSVADRSNPEQVALSTQELTEASVRLKLYLRGHEFELESLAARVIGTDCLTVKQTNLAIHGAKIRVQRAAKDPVIGRVKILIDCSSSMAEGENSLMERSKGYVKGFLKSAASRSDIEVSLYAIGPSLHHDNDGRPSNNPATLSAWVKVNAKDDVWKYQGNGQRLDSTTQAGFLSAVGQLNAYGETPILAALDLALAETVDKTQLLVLLTDGFEFTKETGKKTPRSFDSEQRYVKVRDQLNQRATDLVIFNMSSVDVVSQQLNDLTPRQQTDLRDQFKNSINPSLGLSEIVSRIAKINALSDYRDVGDANNLNRLKQFFAGVLPRPVVERTPPFVSSQDLSTKSPGADMIRVVQLGPNDQPKSWQLGMQFRTDSKIKIFNKQDKQWSTDQQTYGNELLDFIYNPVLSTFQLVTAWEQKEGSKSFLVGSQRLLIHSDPPRIDLPSFLIASSDSQLLTPAPAMVWAVLSQTGQEQQLLLQDFNLKDQTRSNVHRVEFPEVEEVWRNEAILKNGLPIDLTLHWLDRFPADFWSKLNLTDISDRLLITNENGVEVKLGQDTFVSVTELFQMDAAPYKGYDFKLQYINLDNGNIQLTTRVSFAKDAVDLKPKDLDRWMVQVLSLDGTQLHRSCRLQSQRHYTLKSQEAGGQKLVHIDHELTIDREALQRTGGQLGFVNLDEVEAGTAKISRVTFPSYD